MIARIGRRGQLTIPSKLRKQLALREGDRVVLSVRQGEVVVRPTGPSIFSLRGSIPVSGEQDFDEIRAEVMKRRSEERALRGN